MHPMITGPTGGAALEGDPAPFRLEIHDLVKNKYQYSLFIQALRELGSMTCCQKLIDVSFHRAHVGRSFGRSAVIRRDR